MTDQREVFPTDGCDVRGVVIYSLKKECRNRLLSQPINKRQTIMSEGVRLCVVV